MHVHSLQLKKSDKDGEHLFFIIQKIDNCYGFCFNCCIAGAFDIYNWWTSFLMVHLSS